MKLPHQRKYIHGIFSHFPLIFQKQCVCCKYDFIRESMWQFLGGPWHGTSGTRYYLCRECAPTKKSAHDFANEMACKNKVINRPLLPLPTRGIQ